MVVRFFCVIRVLVCARVSRVCVPPPPGVFLPSPNYNPRWEVCILCIWTWAGYMRFCVYLLACDARRRSHTATSHDTRRHEHSLVYLSRLPRLRHQPQDGRLAQRHLLLIPLSLVSRVIRVLVAFERLHAAVRLRPRR